NGVDHELFRPRGEDEICGLMVGAQPVLPGRNYIRSVLSTFAEHKNPKALLKAWTLARPKLPPDWHLVIVGDASNQRVFSFTGFPDDPAERVFLTGYLDTATLPALYSGAAAFVYPSAYDSFGLPVLEAMACGAPVIVNRTAAL